MSKVNPKKVQETNVYNSESVELSKTDTVISTNLDINLDGELDPPDYITSVPVSRKTHEEILVSLKQRETVRSELAIWLTKIFGFSLGASFLLILVTSIYPDADKTEIKDLISVTITPQVTLLSFALGFYFGKNK